MRPNPFSQLGDSSFLLPEEQDFNGFLPSDPISSEDSQTIYFYMGKGKKVKLLIKHSVTGAVNTGR
jgi:hypothetical protein